MARKLKFIIYTFIILFIIFQNAWCLKTDYEKNRIIIKLKSNNYAISTMGSNNLPAKLPQSIQNLNNAYKVISIKSLGTEKRTRIRKKSFSKMTTQEAISYLTKVDAADARYGIDRIYVITFETEIDIPFIIAQYENDENIEYAEPDYNYYLFATPDDPNIATQRTNGLTAIAAEPGWDISTGNSSIIIAIIDTGISLNHEDLVNKLWQHSSGGNYGYDFYYGDVTPNDGDGHGTHVAGIAGAETDNALGIAGIDWNCEIMPLKVFDDSGTSTSATIIASAINYAKNNGAQVINMSFGGPYSNLIEDACNAAHDSGMILVASMGNYNPSAGIFYDTILYPANLDKVIGVGGTDGNDNRYPGSVYGSGENTTEISAPGVTVYSTYINAAKYASMTGTSMSAPHVAGLCALMKAEHPSLSNEDITMVLHNSADDLGDVGYDKYYGYGRINVYNALSLASTYSSSSGATLKDVWNYPNPVVDNGETIFSFKSDKYIKSTEISIYDLKGREIALLESGPNFVAGTYKSGSWDCRDDQGNKLANGTYIFVIRATDGNDKVSVGKGKLSIIN